MSIAAAQNWTQLMAIRALQGFFECTISPGFILIIGTWYRTEEHAARALIWQSANAGVRCPVPIHLPVNTSSLLLIGCPKTYLRVPADMINSLASYRASFCTE